MLLTAILFAAAAPCPIEKAGYQLRGQPTVTARFHTVSRSEDWRSGIALRIHVATSGRSYWFLPWQGGTDGRTNMAWVKERSSPIQNQSVRRDLEILTTDRDYTISAEVPKSGDVAPAHMLMPDLSRLAWLSTTDVDRDNIPRAFFDIARCGSADKAISPEIEFPPVP